MSKIKKISCNKCHMENKSMVIKLGSKPPIGKYSNRNGGLAAKAPGGKEGF